MKLYVLFTHYSRLDEAILMSTHNIPLLYRWSKRPINYNHLRPGIAPWLTLSCSNYPFLDVRAIEVLLYLF